ncbi:MAG: hypothetical protein H7Z37_18630 [Pyrinomonadaceae bacterium]|nr:hypothetical protein [Pyrinomonadaceae bacterium]
MAAVSAQIGTTRKADKNSTQADEQTAQTDNQARPLTAQEARTLSEGIKGLVNQSSEGLDEVQNSDGSISIDLQGRFQNVTVAKKNADGTISHSCVDNEDGASSFFGIGTTKTVGKNVKGTSKAKPVKPIETDAKGLEIK